jgi:hypothetical protein
MSETLADNLRQALSRSEDQIAAFDAEEEGGSTTQPAVKKKKKPVVEKKGLGLNESNKKANAILVKLAQQMQRALDKGAKPGGPEVEKLRQRMLAINTTRIN